MNPTAHPVRRRRLRPGATPALGSVLVHAAALALALGVAASDPVVPEFVSYQIDLVSVPAGPNGDLVVEAPAAPAAEVGPPIPDPAPVERPDPKPVPPVKAEAPKAEPAAAQPSRAQPSGAQPLAQPRATTTGGGSTAGAESAEAMNVRIEGLRRDYPSYYNNIILQIKRCFRWSGQGNPATEVYFVINADGSVGDQRFVRRSGNPSFDFEALGAVECAGQPGRFGPLPDDLPFDRLPIRFTFRPGNVDGIFR